MASVDAEGLECGQSLNVASRARSCKHNEANELSNKRQNHDSLLHGIQTAIPHWKRRRTPSLRCRQVHHAAKMLAQNDLQTFNWLQSRNKQCTHFGSRYLSINPCSSMLLHSTGCVRMMGLGRSQCPRLHRYMVKVFWCDNRTQKWFYCCK